MTTIAIIGTAGRKEDGPKMSRGLYWAMVGTALNQLKEWSYDGLIEKPWKIRSGGAAYSDHVAVTLYHMGAIHDLELHFPAEFLGEEGFKEGTGRFDAGRIANYYHRLFGEKMGGNPTAPFVSLQKAIDLGAQVHVGKGFKERNLVVADVEAMIAFTWGTGDTPKADSGTHHTWRNSKAKLRVHIPLHTLTPMTREEVWK